MGVALMSDHLTSTLNFLPLPLSSFLDPFEPLLFFPNGGTLLHSCGIT